MKIILIAIDTLRTDRLGCYGCKKPAISPNIDALAEQGVLFKEMVAENNVTQSSFVSMMTGKNPYQHGIVNMKTVPISSRLISLAQILQKQGYQTAAVDCNHKITGQPNPWFKKGYHTYSDPSERRQTHLNLPAQEINQKAIPLIKKHRNHPNFFLFLHYWDPHYPYQPDPPFSRWAERHVVSRKNQKEVPLKAVMREPLWSFIHKYNKEEQSPGAIRRQYDGTVKQVDHYIGELITVLNDLKIFDETLIVLVADHGESLGEHRIYFDHHGLYEPTIHVPLILSCSQKLPKNQRISALCQHADILPTILSIAGIKAPRSIGPLDGRSLLPVIRGKKKEIRPFVISCEANWQLKRSIRNHQWKLIHSLEKDVYGNPHWELYNLKQDRGETKNVFSQYPRVAKQLKSNMDRWIKTMLTRYRRKDPLTGGVKVRLHRATVAEEEKVKQRLSELGY
ncbi:sulfatase [Paenactinomyces guangxiensis]|uniref:Sulfatase n=1 Tax=Paenactinomyces guangxiensis TaxID=1490290 RepID=A0A7W2A931_9BACL|nr:sulfatase [Paenactinomyces guangxiensis]MBA4494478.1 sulfatase [Paenactinomyces guangxiensis]MBH8591467.1 sulfatase [Paenactinomyces guangxiensis]